MPSVYSLRKEPRLHLPRDFQVARGAPFGFELLGDGAALQFHSKR